MKEIKINVTQTFSRDFKVELEDNQTIKDAFYEQHYDISGLLDILKSYLTTELYFQDRRQHRISRLLEMIDSCRDWKLNRSTITYEPNNENLGTADKSEVQSD